MAELANCPNCGELFVKGMKTICPSCYQLEEERFEKVYDFIRQKKNRSASLSEVSEATDVKETTIIRYVKEGRIRLMDFPNMTYPCESCGGPIREGKLCDTCRLRLRQGFQRYAEKEAPHNQVSESRQTYFSRSD